MMSGPLRTKNVGKRFCDGFGIFSMSIVSCVLDDSDIRTELFSKRSELCVFLAAKVMEGESSVFQLLPQIRLS